MTNSAVKAFRLPPLILHPFSSPEDTSVLMESSRASLALQGFLPRDETPTQDLDAQLLRGRYAELRMLYYIGKDVARWTEQCTETVMLTGSFEGRTIRPETFAVLLVQHIPAHVRVKLEGWGVLDFCALFRRSIGLHAIFQEIPKVEDFAPDFCVVTIAISISGTNNVCAIGRLIGLSPTNSPLICTLRASMP